MLYVVVVGLFRSIAADGRGYGKRCFGVFLTLWLHQGFAFRLLLTGFQSIDNGFGNARRTVIVAPGINSINMQSSIEIRDHAR